MFTVSQFSFGAQEIDREFVVKLAPDVPERFFSTLQMLAVQNTSSNAMTVQVYFTDDEDIIEVDYLGDMVELAVGTGAPDIDLAGSDTVTIGGGGCGVFAIAQPRDKPYMAIVVAPVTTGQRLEGVVEIVSPHTFRRMVV